MWKKIQKVLLIYVFLVLAYVVFSLALQWLSADQVKFDERFLGTTIARLVGAIPIAILIGWQVGKKKRGD